ncbi:hypothetical protein SDJN02_27451, partial [Cucurbita argyrosperma subsp. argyrosperma]
MKPQVGSFSVTSIMERSSHSLQALLILQTKRNKIWIRKDQTGQTPQILVLNLCNVGSEMISKTSLFIPKFPPHFSSKSLICPRQATPIPCYSIRD